MRIAIVDDIESERKELKERTKKILLKKKLEGTIFEYENSEEFLSEARKEPFQLAFLDIYMEGVDGIAAAKALRTFDNKCILVFTTASADHALEGYQVRAFHYLVKPYGETELETLFDEILSLFPERENYIDVKTSRHIVHIRIRDILWAEHFRHQIHIWLSDGREIVTRTTFSDFSALLCEYSRFFVCGRGILINLDYAIDFDGRVFILKNGSQIPVSRNLADQARTAFGDRLFQRHN